MTGLYLWHGMPDAELTQRLRRLASPQRLKKADALRDPADAFRCLAAEALLRLALPQQKEWTYTCGPHGQPQLPGCRFSLSHAGAYVVCAVADGPVGVDVQPGRPDRERAIRRLLQPEETARDGAALLRLWCAKEAVGKWNGSGLRYGRYACVQPDGRVLLHGETLPCRVVFYPLPDAALALCTDAGERPTPVFVTRQQLSAL